MVWEGGGREAPTYPDRWHALSAELDREARYYGFEVGYEALSPTFRADNGFVRQNHSRRFYLWQGVTMYPTDIIPFMDRLHLNLVAGRCWNFHGQWKGDFIASGLRFQLKRQTNISIRYSFEGEHFENESFKGLRNLNVAVFSSFSQPVQIAFSVDRGRNIARFLDDPTPGRSLDMSLNGTIRPNQRIVLQPRFAFSRLQNLETGEDYFSGYIARMRFGFQFSRHLFLRTVLQYNDFSKQLETDPLLTYKVNAFTAFHVGSTHDFGRYDRPLSETKTPRYFRQSSRQLFFSFQYFVRK